MADAAVAPARVRDLAGALSDPGWLLAVETTAPEESAFAEALLHVSDGYQGLRVTADLDDPHADPGFFVTGLYDAGVGVNREIVNLPNPLGLRVRHDYETPRRDPSPRRVLDMRQGWAYVSRSLSTADGERIRVATITAALATRPGLGVTVGTVELPPGMSSVAVDLFWDNTTGNPYLGGTVPWLRMAHVVVERARETGGGLELACRLAGTGASILLGSRLRCPAEVRRFPLRERDRYGETIVLAPEPGGTASFELVWRCGPVPGPEVPGAWTLLEEHRAEWDRRWAEHGIDIDGDHRAQQAMRFALFHLLQHELPARPGKITPARGLSSSYHSGATFFDTELHKDAYWAWNAPQVARSHLEFRHATLPEARAYARRTGAAGARFPEAANDRGRENGPHKVLAYPQEDVTEWSVREVVHISADVAYATHRYHLLTGDAAFMAAKGVELVLETARFAAATFTWCERRGGYVTRSVMGPDEYHYHVDNNHFTNAMLRWNLRYALALVSGDAGVAPDVVAEVRRRTGVDDAETEHWARIAASVHLPPPLPGGVPSQHEGYDLLPDCPPRPAVDGPAARLGADEAERAGRLADFPTKLIKQSDLVLLAHLLPELFDEETTRLLFDYYEPRTAHESSLSGASHGVVAARLGRTETAHAFFLRSARYNLDFLPRADYRNGLHLSAYAGAWQILVEGLLGVRVLDQESLELRPRLPRAWHGVTVPLRFRDRELRIGVRGAETTVTLLNGPDLRVRAGGREHDLTAGGSVTIREPAGG
ncbi:glycosyl hydrolase family 65 protein [Sphaerisporangium sp. B11E5]|uniref:glycosyl hydrolase family 65 protein n=1 Tax=Sphaerisporangium sp. B11E5 TaxID=3153563 RepID=UPI00325D1A13